MIYILCFIAGSTLGAVAMALLSVSGRASLEDEMREKFESWCRECREEMLAKSLQNKGLRK